jgi:hypothetical protein
LRLIDPIPFRNERWPVLSSKRPLLVLRRIERSLAALCLVSCAVVLACLPVSGAIVGGNGPPAAAATPSATCNQLTKPQVQPLMSATITKVKVTEPLSSAQECVYSSRDNAEDIDVLVVGGSEAKQAFQEDVHGLTSKKAVPGVGEKAYRSKGDFQISSSNGKEFCSVSVGSEETIPGVAAINAANGDTSYVPERDNAVIAEALGTLCNRLYKKGNTKVSLAALGTATTSTGATGGSAASGQPIGTTQSTKSTATDPEKITLVKVIDPAVPNDPNNAAATGMRWVGLDFTAVVEGPDSLGGEPFVIGSDGMTYGFNSAEIIGPFPGCTGTGNNVPQGKPQTLCWGTMIPTGVSVAKVAFSGLGTTQSGTGVLFWSGS